MTYFTQTVRFVRNPMILLLLPMRMTNSPSYGSKFEFWTRRAIW